MMTPSVRFLAFLIAIAGIVLTFAAAPLSGGTARARPLFSLTETAEQATRTPTPVESATPEPTPTDMATPEMPPTETLPPTRPPRGDRDRDTPTPTPDLLLEKRPDREAALPGETLEYTIVVTNRGRSPAFDIVVVDQLPAGLALLDVSVEGGVATRDGQTIRVAIERLDPGGVVTIRVRAQIDALQPPADLRNIASLRFAGGVDTNVEARVVIGDVPTPTPAPPAELPNTGTRSSGVGWILVLAFAAIAIGIMVRRRMRI